MLAILSTHPIQYQVPIWRELARRGEVEFKVYYLSEQGLKSSFDPGFGQSLSWDIDLLSGYPHEFLRAKVGRKQDHFSWLRLAPDFVKRLRADGAHVVWVQGWQVMAYWQAVFRARRVGLDVWLRGDTNLRSNQGGVKQSLKWLVLRRLLSKVKILLTVGSANQAFYRRLGYDDARMRMAPHCVENRRFHAQAEAARPRREALRSAWGIAPNAICLLSVGKFIDKKRQLDLAEAARRLQLESPSRPVHLLWVGSGELESALRANCDVRYAPEIGAVAGNPGPLPPASFAGFLNQTQISDAYVAADALVLSSDAKETWGLVVNEAMASGLPCVVSDACGCADDLVQPFRPDLCFPVGDIDGLCRALRAVMADPPSREDVLRHIDGYDVARTVETVTALYRERHG